MKFTIVAASSGAYCKFHPANLIERFTPKLKVRIQLSTVETPPELSPRLSTYEVLCQQSSILSSLHFYPIIDQEDIPQRVRELKKMFRRHIHNLLCDETDEYEDYLHQYQEEIMKIRKDNRRQMAKKEAEFEAYKKDVNDYFAKMTLKVNQVYFQLKTSIKESTELTKELMRRDLADFKRFEEECNQKEEKVKDEQYQLLRKMEKTFTGEEMALVRQFIELEEQKMEAEYQQQLEELDLPIQMKEILAENAKIKELNEKHKQQYRKEWSEFFNELFASAQDKVTFKVDGFLTGYTDSQKVESQGSAKILQPPAIENQAIEIDAFGENYPENALNFSDTCMPPKKLTTMIEEVKEDVFEVNSGVKEDVNMDIDFVDTMPPPKQAPVKPPSAKLLSKFSFLNKTSSTSATPNESQNDKPTRVAIPTNRAELTADSSNFNFNVEQSINNETSKSQQGNFELNFDQSDIIKGGDFAMADDNIEDNFAFNFNPSPGDGTEKKPGKPNDTQEFAFDFGKEEDGDADDKENDNDKFKIDFGNNASPDASFHFNF